MLSIVREDYDKVMGEKSYKKIIKNKFYNRYIMECYREKMKSSFSTNTDIVRKNVFVGGNVPIIKSNPLSKSD